MGLPVHIISKKRLMTAGARYAEAVPAPLRWYRVARKARWNDIHQLWNDFPHADPVEKFTVFNIKKDEYCLITVIHYNRFKIYIRAVMTHGEYDKSKWKDD